MKYSVDLNCDMGESFGRYKIGYDEQMMHYISSANIACGFHAGDPSIMKHTVKLALERQVAIGAHPGLPDLAGFGRRMMNITPEEAYDYVLYQVGALSAFVRAEGGRLRHVKPHGALYNMAAINKDLSRGISEAIYKLDPEIILYGLAGSRLIEAGRASGLQTCSEVFADRTYQPDGTLTPRSQPDSLLTDDHQAVGQVIKMVKHNKVGTPAGEIEIKAETICIHGDGEHALSFAQKINDAFKKEGIQRLQHG
ncbi:LamB/YcsF family protein [Fictibacillus terranigra]|uniref:5-oxoprolinase subunit A n=1 Tax=Fictibacillus terranigra TaxID=3058424 RepID=A0ABT8E5N2_9BACL|nr:5-oxoprolinase subunit PxpA [Fictibacillus sp. CENA-BCM004]MDN4073194.1 5-oxoprolinase subunit PxpA [Fictibacillus sp. CENA-BCM004]